MRKLIPMTVVALCAFAAPAMAQDGGRPDLDRLNERFEKLTKKLDEIIQPLLKKIEETLDRLVREFESWMEDVNPDEMFGEFDLQQWIEKLREMVPGLPGMEEEDDGDEEFLAPAPPLIC